MLTAWIAIPLYALPAYAVPAYSIPFGASGGGGGGDPSLVFRLRRRIYGAYTLRARPLVAIASLLLAACVLFTKLDTHSWSQI